MACLLSWISDLFCATKNALLLLKARNKIKLPPSTNVFAEKINISEKKLLVDQNLNKNWR